MCVAPSVAMTTTSSGSHARDAASPAMQLPCAAGFEGRISRYLSAISAQEGSVLSQEYLLASRDWSLSAPSSGWPCECPVSPRNTGHSPRNRVLCPRRSGFFRRDTGDSPRDRPEVPRDTTFFLRTSDLLPRTSEVLRASVRMYGVHLVSCHAREWYLLKILVTCAESLASFGAIARDGLAFGQARGLCVRWTTATIVPATTNHGASAD